MNDIQIEFTTDDGNEFWVRQLRGSDDPYWYIFEALSDDPIGVVPDPTEDFKKFKNEAVDITTKYLKAVNS